MLAKATYASSTRPQRRCAHILSRGYRKNLSSGISWFTFFARLTAAYRQRTPQNPSEPERGMREGKIRVLSWECKASHRLGITRTRTDADGSHATRNGRSQRPV